jgi:hypothetical protein
MQGSTAPSTHMGINYGIAEHRVESFSLAACTKEQEGLL